MKVVYLPWVALARPRDLILSRNASVASLIVMRLEGSVGLGGLNE